jgi:hypothetical protein
MVMSSANAALDSANEAPTARPTSLSDFMSVPRDQVTGPAGLNFSALSANFGSKSLPNFRHIGLDQVFSPTYTGAP